MKPQDSTQQAAEEALRWQRRRRLGQVYERVEELPPGTRVFHAGKGLGTVELASPQIISVRFDGNAQVIDLPRTSLRKVTVEALRERRRPLQTGVSQIGGFIAHLAAEIEETLEEEGLENNGIYACEEVGEPPVAPQPLAIDPRVAAAFRLSSGITGFYSHQLDARRHLLDGKNIIISTPTASGKTEAYNPTVLETMLNEPNTTALYLFPLVALGFDQADRLEKLNQALSTRDRLAIGTYNRNVDGESKWQTRRADNRILVTTPDSLHYIFLRNPYANWRRFYRSLRYVVLDEAHVYRGVFGANMANIIRRLLIRCQREGNPRLPQIIISSATVAHPQQLAHQLTGLAPDLFVHIDQSGAPQPKRHFLVTRSDIHDLETLCVELLNVETTDVRSHQGRPVRTIVFQRSINEVKRLAERVRQHLRRHGRMDLVGAVEEFFSERSDKNDVLVRLREGSVRCLFTTNALMAGIDIGGLDVAIVNGFPGLVMDARQMFGRAGRAGEGAAIFLASRTDPFDQFYFERPHLLFHGPTEDVIANPENAYLLAAHLKCAAQVGGNHWEQEGPLPGRWAHLFGDMGRILLDYYVQHNVLGIHRGHYYLDQGGAHGAAPLDNSIRSMENETYSLINRENGQELETRRRGTAFRDAHPEAIVWCSGDRYRVEKLDETTRRITCRSESQTDLRTKGLEEREIEILEREDLPRAAEAELPGAAFFHMGKVRITTLVRKYLIYRMQTVMQCRNRRCRYETPNLKLKRCPQCSGALRARQRESVIEERPVPHQPPLSTELKTYASWIEFPPGLKAQFEEDFWPRWTKARSGDSDGAPVIEPLFEHAVHSVKHALLKAYPDRIRCDRDEIGGLYKLGAADLAARLFVYDDFAGGLGLAEQLVEHPSALLGDALDLIEQCTCDDDTGCPVCLAYFNCHCFNACLSKLAGRYLLRSLLGRETHAVIADLVDHVRVVIPPGQVVHHAEQVTGAF